MWPGRPKRRRIASAGGFRGVDDDQLRHRPTQTTAARFTILRNVLQPIKTLI
jgi:hypothetical protein